LHSAGGQMLYIEVIAEGEDVTNPVRSITGGQMESYEPLHEGYFCDWM